MRLLLIAPRNYPGGNRNNVARPVIISFGKAAFEFVMKMLRTKINTVGIGKYFALMNHGKTDGRLCTLKRWIGLVYLTDSRQHVCSFRDKAIIP